MKSLVLFGFLTVQDVGTLEQLIEKRKRELLAYTLKRAFANLNCSIYKVMIGVKLTVSASLITRRSVRFGITGTTSSLRDLGATGGRCRIGFTGHRFTVQKNLEIH